MPFAKSLQPKRLHSDISTAVASLRGTLSYTVQGIPDIWKQPLWLRNDLHSKATKICQVLLSRKADDIICRNSLTLKKKCCKTFWIQA